MPWQVLEHTADVGLVATGPTLQEALEDLVAGFGHLVCPEGEVQATEERVLQVEAANLGDLVIDLLDELNFVHQMEGFVPVEAEVDLDVTGQGCSVQARIRGEAYDADKHGYLMEIKATTYHALEVHKDPAEVRVIFDI